MGRTDQVLIISTELCKVFIRTTMKVVLAFLFICLIQLSLGNPSSSEGDLSLQREAREAKRGCSKGGQKCRDSNGQKDTKKRQKTRKSKSRPKNQGQKDTKKRQKTRKSKSRPKTQGQKDTKKRQKTRPGALLRSGNERNSTQCFTDLVAKTKKFNRAQVELRLANRVKGWGKLMKNKKNNSASTFSDALEAMNEATGNGKGCEGDSSSFDEAKKVREKLANCSVSAGANCDEGKLSVPINSTLVSSCKTTLKACLTKSNDAEICSCVQGLTNPGDECLDFKAMHDSVKSQKDKCTKGSEEGSFGDCRKQERMAAKFGNKCKKSCKGPGSQSTTQAPAAKQRRELLRKVYNQKMNFV